MRGIRASIVPTLAVLTVALSAAVPSCVANAQTVQGVVVEEGSRRPIGGARLALLGDTGVVDRTVADTTTGMFYLNGQGRGRYRLQIVVGRGGLVVSPRFDLDSTQVLEQMYAVPELPRAMVDAYLPEDVTVPAKFKPTPNGALRYPDTARRQGRTGVFRALLVVDSTGNPVSDTFRVIESPGGDFDDAVRHVVPSWRFTPAVRDGAHVAQVKTISIEFQIADGRLPGFAQSKLLPGEDGIVITALGIQRQR